MKKIIANLYFFKEGGRRNGIPIIKYGCPIFFRNNHNLNDHYYDCQILIEEYGQFLELGKEIERISLVFLSPDKIFPYINIGDKFDLWEGKLIGTGEVVGIVE